jgi:DNA-binding response OmpR family regulator
MEDLFPAGESIKVKTVPDKPQEEATDAEPSKRRGRVLIIEDDPNLCALLLDMLKDQHDVVGCLSREDVTQGKFSSVEYDVALMDAALGIALIDRLASDDTSQRDAAVFVAMADHDFDSGRGQFQPDFVVQKPFDLDELLDAVARGVSVYDSRSAL